MGGTFAPWNFRSMELSSPGTFAPESENDMELSLPEWKMACNFHSTPCPKIVVATNCTHGEQGSQDVIPYRPTRPVEACRPSEAIQSRSRSSWNTTGIPLIRPTGIMEYSEFTLTLCTWGSFWPHRQICSARNLSARNCRDFVLLVRAFSFFVCLKLLEKTRLKFGSFLTPFSFK